MTNESGGSPRARRRGGVGRWLVRIVLVTSLLANVGMLFLLQDYFDFSQGLREHYHSGSQTAQDKLAVINVSGTIMPPFTERILRSIDQAEEDDDVKGIVLVVDSPGGLVADSHQIYHRLSELRQKKPIVVSMKRIAASGGLYVAMGAGEEGRIFAEPTTWTGSIGVIIPRYDLGGLAQKLGIESDPLKTGEFKDALSPFRDLTEAERAVWDDILQQSFERFVKVIDENRKPLDYEGVRKLATGQIFTADDAQANGLIDAIGFEDDAIEDLKQRVGLKEARVVTYEFPPTLAEILIGTVQARDPAVQWRAVLDATVPQQMYFCSWAPVLTFRR